MVNCDCKTVTVISKDLGVDESRASAQRKMNRICAIVFLRKSLLDLRSTVGKQHPTRLRIYLRCHSLLCTYFLQAFVVRKGLCCVFSGDVGQEAGKYADLC